VWPQTASAFSSAPVTAPSPTAFLEMLSSAASAQSFSAEPTIPGLRAGAAENAMMSSTWAATPDAMNVSSGLTPFLSFTDNQEAQPASEMRPEPDRHDTNGTTTDSIPDSRRSSAANGSTLVTPSSAADIDYSKSYEFKAGMQDASGENLNWPPVSIGPGLQPSTRTEGPWRGVETVSSVFGQQANAMPDIQATSQPVDSNAEFNEAMQQQLLLDLFWPGWPQHLPEPNIVNDL